MAEGIGRRQFFNLVGERLRKPIRIAFLCAIAWLAIAVIRAACGITLDGWKLIGCLVLVAIATAATRYGAGRVYAMLPAHGKALCAAMGETLSMLILMALGALLWHLFQTKHATGVVALVILACAADRVYTVYNQRMAELLTFARRVDAGRPSEGRKYAESGCPAVHPPGKPQ